MCGDGLETLDGIDNTFFQGAEVDAENVPGLGVVVFVCSCVMLGRS